MSLLQMSAMLNQAKTGSNLFNVGGTAGFFNRYVIRPVKGHNRRQDTAKIIPSVTVHAAVVW